MAPERPPATGDPTIARWVKSSSGGRGTTRGGGRGARGWNIRPENGEGGATRRRKQRPLRSWKMAETCGNRLHLCHPLERIMELRRGRNRGAGLCAGSTPNQTGLVRPHRLNRPVTG